MSQMIKGILAVAAVSLTCGAVQLASGHDLGVQALSSPAGDVVNRAAKADRAPVAAAVSSMPTRTVSVQPISLADTSVLIRIPLTQHVSHSAPAPMLVKSSSHKPSAACEPVVSVLTEIAKRLQPGRCVT